MAFVSFPGPGIGIGPPLIWGRDGGGQLSLTLIFVKVVEQMRTFAVLGHHQDG